MSKVHVYGNEAHKWSFFTLTIQKITYTIYGTWCMKDKIYIIMQDSWMAWKLIVLIYEFIAVFQDLSWSHK